MMPNFNITKTQQKVIDIVFKYRTKFQLVILLLIMALFIIPIIWLW